jgi:hypothetical protein
MYLESIDQEEVPWGAALKLDHAIQTEKNVYIRQIRFYREQRGVLGVLSAAGQFQVYHINREYVEPSSVNDISGSPELLEVKKSHDLEYAYFDQDHKRRAEDRIVSFDWLNLGTSDLPGRVIALRGNGSFEILQMPVPTAGLLSNLIPWKPPHRRKFSGITTVQVYRLMPPVDDHYLTLMEFNDPNERDKVLGPLFASEAKTDASIFGPQKFTLKSTKAKLESRVKKMLQYTHDPVVNMLSLAEAVTIPELRSPKPSVRSVNLEKSRLESKISRATSKTIDPVSSAKVLSSRELHDKSHYTTMNFGQSEKPKNDIPDHVMLQRATRGYLFDCEQNMAIVADDPWLQDVWGWVRGKTNTLLLS